MERKIKSAETEEEKQNAYSYQIQKYKKAVKNEFYLEGICIVYGILENQLYSFLYLSGCVDKDLNVTKKYRPLIRKIWDIEPKKHSKLNNISDKIDYILKMLQVAEKGTIDIEMTESQREFFNDLVNKISNEIDSDRLKETFTKIEKWCELRNEIIHGLLNKKTVDLLEKQKQSASEGIGIAEELKKILNKYNSGIDIRKKFKIQR